MYSTYSDAHEFAALTLVTYATKNKEFADFIDEAESNDRLQNQTLQSLLIMPIQRVLRYNLILQDMHKDLRKKNPDHADVPLLEEVLL